MAIPYPGWFADFRKLGRSFLLTASEGYSYSVSIRSSLRKLSSVSGVGSPNIDLQLKLPRLPRGTYRLVVKVGAETNPGRVTTFTRRFRV